MVDLKTKIVSVTGLGYVGLPVATAFSQKYKVIGFDVHAQRIEELKNHFDRTGELTCNQLQAVSVFYTSNPEDLRQANFHIVTVPTPVDKNKKPDLTPMIRASQTLGAILKKGDIVVFESTVYPGVCEEECLPVLEKVSGLKGGVDFKIGYSPERINPGDRQHTFTKILKVVSAQDAESLQVVSAMYSSVVEAGVYEAKSIKVAEAAKVIENTQRDLNIALVNELSIIFDKIGIDTHEVLKAASTKWNFMPFKPGLVGGHCIGVDPYYLTHKAESLGYHPQVILSGRKINDSMAGYIAERCKGAILESGQALKESVVSILGVTFKENCPDLRNSKVFDIISELKQAGVQVQVHDPIADVRDETEVPFSLTPMKDLRPARVVIVAVAHRDFFAMDLSQLSQLCAPRGWVFDLKGILSEEGIKAQKFRYWRL